jgi:hypothetical protein
MAGPLDPETGSVISEFYFSGGDVARNIIFRRLSDGADVPFDIVGPATAFYVRPTGPITNDWYEVGLAGITTEAHYVGMHAFPDGSYGIRYTPSSAPTVGLVGYCPVFAGSVIQVSFTEGVQLAAGDVTVEADNGSCTTSVTSPTNQLNFGCTTRTPTSITVSVSNSIRGTSGVAIQAPPGQDKTHAAIIGGSIQLSPSKPDMTYSDGSGCMRWIF